MAETSESFRCPYSRMDASTWSLEPERSIAGVAAADCACGNVVTILDGRLMDHDINGHHYCPDCQLRLAKYLERPGRKCLNCGRMFA